MPLNINFPGLAEDAHCLGLHSPLKDWERLLFHIKIGLQGILVALGWTQLPQRHAHPLL